MKRMNDGDALKNAGWTEAYADVPENVQLGVQQAFLQIRVRERRRRNALRGLACAACFACVAVGALLGLNLHAGQDVPDHVAEPAVQLRSLAPDDIVYAARADACFHVRSDCSEAMAEQVELQLQTALEFEKTLCPVCGAYVQLKD